MTSRLRGYQQIPIVLVAAACWATLWQPLAAQPQRSESRESAASSASADRTAVDRSPIDLVIGPGEEWLATANQTSDSVSLVRIADGKVLDEKPVGRRPTALVLHPDGKTLLVSTAFVAESPV